MTGTPLPATGLAQAPSARASQDYYHTNYLPTKKHHNICDTSHTGLVTTAQRSLVRKQDPVTTQQSRPSRSVTRSWGPKTQADPLLIISTPIPAMAHQPQQQQQPMTQEEAHMWAKRQGSIGFKDAALLNRIRFQSGQETGILHVGCGLGTFPIAAYKVTKNLTLPPFIIQNTVPIVGIDNCQPLLDLANGVLADEASRDQNVRNMVQFRRMDAFSFGNQANIDMILNLFPHGISTVVVTDVFDDINDPATVEAIHNLIALLRVGGRIIFDVCYQPRCWSAAHFLKGPAIPPNLVGIINLATPQFIQDAEQGIHNSCRHIAESRHQDVNMLITDIDCVWLGKVWDQFANHVGELPAFGLQINDEATFSGDLNTFHNTADPRIRYEDSSTIYCTKAIQDIMDAIPMQQIEDDTHTNILLGVFGSHGLEHLQHLFREWKPDFFDSNNDAIGTHLVAADIITRYSAAIVEPWRLPDWDTFYLSPASVLVSLRRM